MKKESSAAKFGGSSVAKYPQKIKKIFNQMIKKEILL